MRDAYQASCEIVVAKARFKVLGLLVVDYADCSRNLELHYTQASLSLDLEPYMTPDSATSPRLHDDLELIGCDNDNSPINVHAELKAQRPQDLRIIITVYSEDYRSDPVCVCVCVCVCVEMLR